MFFVDKTNSNIRILNQVNESIPITDKLITNFKIGPDKIQFNIKDNNPFLVCQYLSDNLLNAWIRILDQK